MRKSGVLLKTFAVFLSLASSVLADSILSLEASRSVYSNDLNRIVQEKSRMLAAALQIYAEGLTSSRIAYVRSSNLDGVKAVDRASGCLSALGDVVETLFTTNIVAQYKERERFANMSFDKSHLTLLDLYQKSLAKTLRVVLGSNDLARAELIDAEIKKVNSERSVIVSRIKQDSESVVTKAKSVEKGIDKPRDGVVGVWKRTDKNRKVKDSLFVLQKNGSFQSDATDPGWWKTYGNGNILLEWEGPPHLVRKFSFSADKNSFSGINASPAGVLEETFTFVKEIP